MTVNAWGKGRAYYIASRNDERFHDDFYGALTGRLGLASALGVPLPPGVTAQVRGDDEHVFVFVINFTAQTQTIALAETMRLVNLETGETHQRSLTLDGYRGEVYERF